MSNEGNLPVNLSHATSIDTIWDFDIQEIDNQVSVPLTAEHSEDGRSPSTSALSTAPSGLLTPTLGSNTEDGSSSGGGGRIYERRRKVQKSWVYHSDNGGEYFTSDGRTRWRCARCMFLSPISGAYTNSFGPNKRTAATFADASMKNMIEHLRDSHKIGKHGAIEAQLERGQLQIETAFGNTRLQIVFNQGVFCNMLLHWIIQNNISFRRSEEHTSELQSLV